MMKSKMGVGPRAKTASAGRISFSKRIGTRPKPEAGEAGIRPKEGTGPEGGIRPKGQGRTPPKGGSGVPDLPKRKKTD